MTSAAHARQHVDGTTAAYNRPCSAHTTGTHVGLLQDAGAAAAGADGGDGAPPPRQPVHHAHRAPLALWDVNGRPPPALHLHLGRAGMRLGQVARAGCGSVLHARPVHSPQRPDFPWPRLPRSQQQHAGMINLDEQH